MSQLNDAVLNNPTSIEGEQELSEIEIIEMRVKEFCEKIQISPIGTDGKINRITASYHRSTDIQKVVRDILGDTKIGITGRMLLKNMRYGVHILEQQSSRGSYANSEYALTKQGVQEVFEIIEMKKIKPRLPGASYIGLPIAGNGTSQSRSGIRGANHYS